MKVILAPNGAARHEVELSEIEVPDLWHIASALRDEHKPRAANAVLECWHLAQDLIWNLQNLETPGRTNEALGKAAVNRLNKARKQVR